MNEGKSARPDKKILAAADFQRLMDAITDKGYKIIGPTVRDGAIVYDRLDSASSLPVGVGEEQDAGRYRLAKRDGGALFGYTIGPQSWKKFLFPPRVTLWSAEVKDSGIKINVDNSPVPRFAFLGVRPCELSAIAIQDKIFTGGENADGVYAARREKALIVAVNCGRADGTCFCVSMGTGPKASGGYDIALTEIIDEAGHCFLVESGSPQGDSVLSGVPLKEASAHDIASAEAIVSETARNMGRKIDTEGIKKLLYKSYEAAHWNDVAKRCLACANCTMVCPTCFCSTVEDVTDLAGANAERRRRWDSCFTMGFTYIHGGSVRQSIKSRYRHWMIHKLASWHDQFGTSGCVGCGRCITWCPAAIDITEEARAAREAIDGQKSEAD